MILPGLALVILCLFGLRQSAGGEIDPTTPHAAANECRKNFVEECTSVCLVCHSPPESTDQIENALTNGDAIICGECHQDRLFNDERRKFLLRNLGGNHPSNIAYPEGSPSFYPAPEGVKIFRAEDRTICSVQCSSCHDPHEVVKNLLRVDNRGSRLCTSCHRK